MVQLLVLPFGWQETIEAAGSLAWLGRLDASGSHAWQMTADDVRQLVPVLRELPVHVVGLRLDVAATEASRVSLAQVRALTDGTLTASFAGRQLYVGSHVAKLVTPFVVSSSDGALRVSFASSPLLAHVRVTLALFVA